MSYATGLQGRRSLSADEDVCANNSENCTCSVSETQVKTAALNTVTTKALVDYVHQKKARIQHKGDDTSECIRLRRNWELVKRSIKRAQNRLAKAAREVESTRREFSDEMNKDISVAFMKLTLDLVGAAAQLISFPVAGTASIGKAADSAVEAAISFHAWRRKFNRELPARISRHLLQVQTEYRAAVELLRDEVENERKITERMSSLQCANF